MQLVQAGQCGILRCVPGGGFRGTAQPCPVPPQDSPSRGARQAVTVLAAPGQGQGAARAQFKEATSPLSSLHSSHPEGKIAVCQEEVIPVLVGLLEDTQPPVQANSAGALMFALVTPQGERQRQSCWGTPGNPILGQLTNKTCALPALKPSVSDCVNARQETLRLGHFFITIFSNYCYLVTVPRGDRIFHIWFP